jgi:excisionase family DNA binding protein
MQNKIESGNPEYMTVGLVARRCGVSNTTVLRWIKKGQLCAFRLPAGHYRVGSGAFNEFLTKYDLPPAESR